VRHLEARLDSVPFQRAMPEDRWAGFEDGLDMGLSWSSSTAPAIESSDGGFSPTHCIKPARKSVRLPVPEVA
jgi:hypothetical protein